MYRASCGVNGGNALALNRIRFMADVAKPAASSEEELLKSLQKGIAPATGRPLREIAADVWGHTKHPAGPGNRSGRKILERPLKGPLYMSWYPQRPESIKENRFKLTEKQERWQQKLKLLRAGGKGPPKKGAGKRSK